MKMTKSEIEGIEPSKKRVNKQLDELGITDLKDRDAFHKGVMFCKGFYIEDLKLRLMDFLHFKFKCSEMGDEEKEKSIDDYLKNL